MKLRTILFSAGISLAVCLTASFCASTAIADDASAGSPTVHTGDVWVDRLSSGDQDFAVTAVTADEIAYSEWGAKMASDLHWNPIETRSIANPTGPAAHYEKPLPLFPFPLTPGQTWNSEVSWEVPHTSQSGRVKVAGTVGDWEQVTVPAGVIRALRVDVSSWAVGEVGYMNKTAITYWYAPNFNRFVKVHIEDGQETIDAELVSYKPAKQAAR